MRPAVVMNMFYTGLGIARSLGERRVRVFGLTAQRGVYGNYTRYAKSCLSPDSRTEPEALRDYLLRLGEEIGERSVIFPTRDDDLKFLDRYRKDLEPSFILTIPESHVLETCLDKWQTYFQAQQAGVDTPRCWLIRDAGDLEAAAAEAGYPCVLKPVAAYHWRKGGNWDIVGSRKAIAVFSEEQLLNEYALVAKAEPVALLQELVPGGDDCLEVAAVYLNRQSEFIGGFNARKLAQLPPGFGTGCVVEAVERPELFGPTLRLLQQIQFTGIAEVEYKWDARRGKYQLIEINPRPWDQHRLGLGCGVDVIFLAYAEHAGLPKPELAPRRSAQKWIAEDALARTAISYVWNRDPGLWNLLRKAKGKRIYAIWSARDPLPGILYLFRSFVPGLVTTVWRALRPRFGRATRRAGEGRESTLVFQGRWGKERRNG